MTLLACFAQGVSKYDNLCKPAAAIRNHLPSRAAAITNWLSILPLDRTRFCGMK
jgi:hypothetical protein